MKLCSYILGIALGGMSLLVGSVVHSETLTEAIQESDL